MDTKRTLALALTAIIAVAACTGTTPSAAPSQAATTQAPAESAGTERVPTSGMSSLSLDVSADR